MKSDQISEFLQERIDADDFPSAVYLVAEKGRIVFQDALGLAVAEPEKIEAKTDTIYDLASLTKVLITGLLTARLVDAGKILLDERVSPPFNNFTDDKSDITLKNLLTHTSGLQAWRPFYLDNMEIPLSVAAVASRIAELPLANQRNTTVTYSDLNFLVLTNMIERIFDARFHEIAEREIINVLGLVDTAYSPPAVKRKRIAASEKGNEFEKKMCLDMGYLAGADPLRNPVQGKDKFDEPSEKAAQFRFRDSQIWGEVHDGNAWFMGGVSGHAGLFSTAEEVFKIAQQFLPNYTSLIKLETCELFSTNFTPGMNEHRSFAFQLASTPDSTAGTRMSPESFGHLGFTGTSLWIDPIKERIFVLLTNRTHHHALPFANGNAARRRFHDLAVDHLEKNRSN